MMVNQRSPGLIVLRRLILIFPNFQPKNWQNDRLFQFLKKQGDKNFFLGKIYRYSPPCHTLFLFDPARHPLKSSTTIDNPIYKLLTT
jgi:hypothetical protein